MFINAGERTALFCFHHLVETPFPGAVWHGAAGVGIDDQYFPFVDKVVLVPVEKIKSMQGAGNEFFPQPAVFQEAVLRQRMLF